MSNSDYVEVPSSTVTDVEPDAEVDFPFIRAVKYVFDRMHDLQTKGERNMSEAFTVNVPGLEDMEDDNLDNAEWYFGDIDKSEANLWMRDKPVGSFMVRDSSSGNANEYTLTLKMAGDNNIRLIKIYCVDGKYGFSYPYQFRSVVELIKFYGRESMALYNPKLNIRLLYPVSRNEKPREIFDIDIGNESEVKQELARVDEEISQLQEQCTQLSEDYHASIESVTRYRDMVVGYKTLIAWLNDTITTNETVLHEVPPHEVPLRIDGILLMKKKIEKCKDIILKLDKEFAPIIQFNRILDRKRGSVKPQLAWLSRRKKALIRIIEQKNRKVDTDVHKIEDAWFLPNASRAEADELLCKRKDGTFLIRKSRQDGQFALSIINDRKVYHCLITKTARGYGFSEPYDIHQTLSDLVLHYASTSLEEHNDNLRTRLLYPIFESKYRCIKKDDNNIAVAGEQAAFHNNDDENMEESKYKKYF